MSEVYDKTNCCIGCGRHQSRGHELDCRHRLRAVEQASASGPNVGADLLERLVAALKRYVILPSEAATDAVALWIAATHAQQAWQSATRLVITAPEKRCGKSRLLDIIEATCHKPLMTVNISPAALVRSIGEAPPTLLLDEADTYFGKKAADNHEDLRGILNAGHQRNRPYIRWDANTRQPEKCATFAMAALAGIGSMPDTIEDRAVMIRMRRRGHAERVQPFRARRDGPPLEALRREISAWAREHLDELEAAEPDMPVEDRAADNWEPLISVADVAGGRWPADARRACRELTSGGSEDTSVGVRLLKDLREVFGDADALHGVTLLDRLHKMEEAPWGDWYGKPLDARKLAELLRPYGVRSTKVKIIGKALQGYRREDLYDSWNRYLPPRPEDTGTSGTNGTQQVTDSPEVPGSGTRTEPEPDTPPLTCEVPEVPEVLEPSRSDGPEGTATCAVADVAGTPATVGTCAGCGEPMKVITPGQIAHPDDECETRAKGSR